MDYVLFTPTFKGVGSELDLTSIKMIDENGDEFDPYEGVTVQVMDEDGNYTDVYAYSPAFYTHGWALDGVEIAPGEVTIPVGRAFCVNNACGQKVYLSVAGEVDLLNKNYIPNIDYVLWGNSTPISIDLTDVKLVDENGDEFDPYEGVTLQVMDEDGNYTDVYAYSPAFYTNGWALDGAEVKPTDFVINPGQSFCVNNACGQAVYIKLPNPTSYTLPKAE